jgi:hypothetical protein
MARRAKIESFAMACDGFLEIIYLSQQLKAGGHSGGEVMQVPRAMWMAKGGKIESFTVACDGFPEIFRLSQMLKAGANNAGEVIEG